MALQLLALTFFLVLILLLGIQTQEDTGPETQGLFWKTACPKPEWDSSLRFVPEKTFYDNGEELTLSCLTEDDPPLAVIRCVVWIFWGHTWEVKDKQGRWHHTEMYQACTGKCQKPQWDRRVVLVPRKDNYTPNEELRLSCPGVVKPSFISAKCVREFQGETSGKPVYGDSWWGRRGTGAWTRIEEPVACVVKCSRPQWDADIRLAPERDVYEEGEEVRLSCPEGSLLPFQQAKCAWRPRAVATGEHKGTWTQKNKSGQWVPIQSPITCISTCQKPLWDPRLRLAPEQEEYNRNEEVMLSCPKGFEPSFTHIKCLREVQSTSARKRVYRELWLGKGTGGAWTRIRSVVQCVGKCQKPRWDPRLIFVPDMASYVLSEVVVVSCPEGHWPPPMKIACVDIPGQSSPTPQRSWVVNKSTDYWQPVDHWLCVGQPPGPWPWTVVTVVAALSAMVMLSAGILGFVMCRRRKALPRKAEEDHYTELQPYENLDHYCVIKERFLAEEDAGRGGRAGERPSPSLRRTLGDHCGCQRAETVGRTIPA